MESNSHCASSLQLLLATEFWHCLPACEKALQPAPLAWRARSSNLLLVKAAALPSCMPATYTVLSLQRAQAVNPTMYTCSQVSAGVTTGELAAWMDDAGAVSSDYSVLSVSVVLLVMYSDTDSCSLSCLLAIRD